MGLKGSQVVFLVGLLVVLSYAQHDQPGPPYPDAHTSTNAGNNRNQWGSPTERYKSRNHERHLPLVTPNILQALYKALGPGVPVEMPFQSRTPKQFVVQTRQQEYSQQPQQQYASQQHNVHGQSGVQTAHVYIPNTNKNYMQRPMHNVIVKYHAQGSRENQHDNFIQQPIEQYSQPDPVVQSVQVGQFSTSQQQYPQQPHQIVHQQSQPQGVSLQYSHSQITNTQHHPPQYPQQAQLQSHTNLNQESQTASPSHSAINLQFPAKKWEHRSKSRQRHHHYRLKALTYKKKAQHKIKHIQAFPVFTTIGKGLDGLNAVRRGVKRGTGQVVATGVKLGGKLAYAGAGVVAKVIKVASSI